MTASALKPSVISLSNTIDPLVVRGDCTEVEFRDGKKHVRSGEIATTPTTSSLSTTAALAALKTGDVIKGGPSSGWIYCKGENFEPFLVAPKDSGVMQWREAMKYAAQSNSELPSKQQLNAMYEARNMRALKGTFNLTSSGPAGWYWSATQYDGYYAWCQRFGAGYQINFNKLYESSVRCVRRYSII